MDKKFDVNSINVFYDTCIQTYNYLIKQIQFLEI
jgi:hypothetical protein